MPSIGIEAPRQTDSRSDEGHPAPATKKTEDPAKCRVFLCPPITHSMSALHSIADLRVVESLTTADDPKQTLGAGYKKIS